MSKVQTITPLDQQLLAIRLAGRPDEARELAARLYERADQRVRFEYWPSRQSQIDIGEWRLCAALLDLIADGRLRLED